MGARCASLSGGHLFDLLEAAIGPVEELSGRGDPLRWVSLTLPLAETVFECVLYGPSGTLTFRRPPRPAVGHGRPPGGAATLRREFAGVVTSGNAPALDVNRGLRLQRLIDAAARSLG